MKNPSPSSRRSRAAPLSWGAALGCLLVSGLAGATGIPPHPELRLADETCRPEDPAWCPPESPVTHLPTVYMEPLTNVGSSQMALPPEGFSVIDTPEGARLLWLPIGEMRAWGQHGLADGLRSAPMPRREAEAALAAAETLGGNLSVMWHIAESRQRFEGTLKRGVTTCESVYEEDIVLTLIGPNAVLRGTAGGRAAAPPESCYLDSATPSSSSK